MTHPPLDAITHHGGPAGELEPVAEEGSAAFWLFEDELFAQQRALRHRDYLDCAVQLRAIVVTARDDAPSRVEVR